MESSHFTTTHVNLNCTGFEWQSDDSYFEAAFFATYPNANTLEKLVLLIYVQGWFPYGNIRQLALTNRHNDMFRTENFRCCLNFLNSTDKGFIIVVNKMAPISSFLFQEI